MKKSRYVTGDDPIKFFLTTEVESTFSVLEGVMAVEVTQNEAIFGEEKNGGTKGVGFAIRRKRANRGSINIKKARRSC